MVEIFLEALSKEFDLDVFLHEAVHMNRLDLIELLHRFGANRKPFLMPASLPLTIPRF